ncbi:hypothetical protein [Streptomyces sp. SID10815]|uniref:hypothetical protein n=1 Tax=Streptomyces sp. SID10815 TaxID=2706027 RepID=UPI0013CA7FBF|nr:hypothetical protein [Streptomyces sp. SID10815]NEA46628.1 hypothetical protein [Streptomyces sp. SID10815]
MSAAENPSRPYPAPGVRMSDLLASCAAAAAVSRPPRAPEPADAGPDPRSRTPRPGAHRDARTARTDARTARTAETHREAA